MTLTEQFVHYLTCYQRKDIEAISRMFAHNIHLRDWKISVQGKSIALLETQKNFDNATSIDIGILTTM